MRPQLVLAGSTNRASKQRGKVLNSRVSVIRRSASPVPQDGQQIPNNCPNVVRPRGDP